MAVEQAVGKAHISAPAASAAVTLPTALCLRTVRLLHARHFKVGITRQLVLPGTALAVIACTFPGDWAVFAAGIVAASAVVAGTSLTARTPTRENRTGARAAWQAGAGAGGRRGPVTGRDWAHDS